MTPLGLTLGGAALVGIGVGIGARLAGRRLHHRRDLEQIANLAGQVDALEETCALLAQSTRRAWQLVERAGLRPPDNPFRGQWVAPTPQAWATFQEGREKPWRN